MRILLILSVLSFAGCSVRSPDPASRLEAGSRAMLVRAPADYDYDVTRLEVVGESGPYLSLGTRVRVVDDTAEPGGGRTRKVKVHVEEGEHAGRAGTLRRWDLRPE